VTDRREMRRNSWNKAISRDKTGTAPPLTYVDWDTTGRDLSGCPQPATISGKLIEPYVVEAALALLPLRDELELHLLTDRPAGP
jgi:hypothetical protein